MDPTLAYMPDAGDMGWSDNRSMSSEEGPRDFMAPSSPPSRGSGGWMDGSPAARPQSGQRSPLSAGMAGMAMATETPLDGSSAPTMIHSASSSCADTWSVGIAERDDAENEAHWEQGSDDILTIPKLEPTEDDFNMDDLKAAPLAPVPQPDGANGTQVKQKRPRGRPRKHPLNPVVPASKITKGRSKTGCITCRKRKKKCDEAKPRCMNCEKNAVVCEGYHEKQLWRSGRERAEDERERRESLPMITMQPIFHGVETAEDKVFWKHYMNRFSNVLTYEGESRNAFKDIMLNLANQDQGLMHSILALSSKHVDYDEPYGASILQENPGVTRESLEERSDYHHDAAMSRLCQDIDSSPDKDGLDHMTILSARYGQMLCLLLETRADGNPRGEHRVHLQAYQALIQNSPPEDPAFQTFITEFFQYHIYADDLFWHPEAQTKRLSSEDWEPSIPIHPPRLLGVADGLFQYLSQITTIRNAIRANMVACVDPLVDYTNLYRAAGIDAAIRDWAPDYPPGDSRARVALLYKQMMWVYLFRTIYPPNATPIRRSTIHAFPVASDLSDMPGRRAPLAATVGSSASTPGTGVSSPTAGIQITHSCPPSRHPSRSTSMHELDSQPHAAHRFNTGRPTPRHPMRTASLHEQDSHSHGHAAYRFGAARPPSPPPIRRPTHHDRRITLAVEESLTILESFKPSDPAQTLLLIPCMVIGTACFHAAQQERIRTAIRAVRGYTGLRNCDRVSEVLAEIWALMEQGDWIAVWDWQGVARRMGLDFLCT